MTTTQQRPTTAPAIIHAVTLEDPRQPLCMQPDQAGLHRLTHADLEVTCELCAALIGQREHRCYSNQHWHMPHTWTYGGRQVLCDGKPETRIRVYDRPDRGQCCSDPLCGCSPKPGWGAYAARERRANLLDDDGYDGSTD